MMWKKVEHYDAIRQKTARAATRSGLNKIFKLIIT